MAIKPLPSQEVLRQLLRYEPETGKLFWEQRPVSFFPDERASKVWNTRYAGKEAFTAKLKGYRQGRLLDRFVSAHRVAWKIVHDEEPEEIDHINGVRDDNRLVNMRAVDRVENMRNAAIWGHNTSGHAGVNWHKKNRKWQAHIFFEKKSHYLGIFENINDAIAARKAAEVKFGFHINHGRQP